MLADNQFRSCLNFIGKYFYICDVISAYLSLFWHLFFVVFWK